MKHSLLMIGILSMLVLALATLTQAAPAVQPALIQDGPYPTETATAVPTAKATPESDGHTSAAAQTNCGMMRCGPGMMDGRMGGGNLSSGSMHSSHPGNSQMGSGHVAGGHGAGGQMPGWAGGASAAAGSGTSSMSQTSMMTGVTAMHAEVAQLFPDMSVEELYNEMMAGKSLLELAAEYGISEQQLLDSLKTGRAAAIQEAVKAGHMTQVQADAILVEMENHLRLLANTAGPAAWGMMWGMQFNP